MLMSQLLTINCSYPQSGTFGSWHNEINNSTRPRLLLLSKDTEAIRRRLATGVFHQLYNNEYLNRFGGYVGGVYQKALIFSEPRTDWKQTAQRAIIAKNAAFVYFMNRAANGVDELHPEMRIKLRDKIIKYLCELDPAVRSCWKDFGDVQWRARELLYYCQAYDLLMAAPDAALVQKLPEMEERLHLFAANLFTVLDKWKEPWIPLVTSKDNKRILAAASLGVAGLTLNQCGSDQEQRSADRKTRALRPDSWIGAAMNTVYYLLRSDDDASLVTRDGSYREGPHYYRYVATTVFPFMRAMKNFQEILQVHSPWREPYFNFGKDWPKSSLLENPYHNPMFRRSFDYYTAIRQPEGRLPALKDTFTDEYFPELALFAELDPVYAWPLTSFDPGWDNLALLNTYLGQHSGADSRIDYICAAPPLADSVTEQDALFKSFPAAGSYIFRANGNEGELYIHLFAGNEGWGNTSHYQEDASSFILNFGGQVLALDPGYISSPKSHLVNKAENHNIVLVEGESFSPEKRFFLQEQIDQPSYHFVRLSDQPRASESRRFRSLLALKNNKHPYALLYDECDYGKIKQFQFLLHGNGHIGEGSFEIEPASGRAEWRQLDKVLEIHSVSAPTGRITHSEAIHEVGYNRTAQHSVFENMVIGKRAQFLTLLDAYSIQSLTVNRFSAGEQNSAGFIISSPGSVVFDLFMIGQGAPKKLRASDFQLQLNWPEIETDAQMLYLRAAQDLTSIDDIEIFTQNATYVRIGQSRFLPENSSGFCRRFRCE